MQGAHHKAFAKQVSMAMLIAIIVGLISKALPSQSWLWQNILTQILPVLGQMFIQLLKMVVVPIVLVSIVNGVVGLGHNQEKLGRIGVTAIILYLFTTAFAIALALIVADFWGVGHGLAMTGTSHFTALEAPSFSEVLRQIIPANPVQAMAEGNMLQIIFFALFLGFAIQASDRAGKALTQGFQNVQTILINGIWLIMRCAPLGIFCLVVPMIYQAGETVLFHLLEYICTVLTVLVLHIIISYGSLLRLFARRSLWLFLRDMRSAMLFAFCVSSSNASIPVVMETAREKLKVHDSIVSFVIPLGSTINMDGTAIMQGVATVFISNVYGIDLGLSGYMTVIIMATLASIGTAGVPGVGLITLAMVLQQVGLPVEGIAMIFGVDRIIDMARTAVNITGDCAIACVIDKCFSLPASDGQEACN